MDLNFLHTSLLRRQAKSLVQREYKVRRNLVNNADPNSGLGYFSKNDTRRAMLNLLLHNEFQEVECTPTSDLVEHSQSSKPTVLTTMEGANELGVVRSWMGDRQMRFKPTEKLLIEYDEYIRQWWQYTFEADMESDYFAIRGILHAMGKLR